MVGLVGVVLVFLGSFMAIFTAEITNYGSDYEAAENLQEQGLIGLGLSLVGLIAIFKVQSIPRIAAFTIALISTLGLIILHSYFLFGAVLLLLSAYYAIRGYYFSKNLGNTQNGN